MGKRAKIRQKLMLLTRPIYLLRRIHYRLYELRHPDDPWISQGAVRYFEANLHPPMQGLEWGSGRSTTWFAARLEKLTSVEHDRAWFEIVEQKLKDQGVANVDFLYVGLDHPLDEPTFPDYDETPSYVDVVSRFADESLDFCIVDGHYRQACVKAVLAKLKPGGLLAIDNTDWLPRAEWNVPEGWLMVHESQNVMTQTTVWRRPD